jgi:hypothetical protein|tara:strand:+ start:1535 stop:2077 length:543 start_codon:yes stop_codon:yes gene_type:complete
MTIRNRKVKTRRVKADTLLPNPLNWRSHPSGQRSALQAVLTEVGDVDYLKVVDTEHGLMLIDGHLRADIRGDDIVDVVVLDLTEDEQRLVLATFDPLAAMAGRDTAQMASLLEGINNETSPDLSRLLTTLDLTLAYPSLELLPSFPEPSLGSNLDETLADSISLCVCETCGHEHAKAKNG